MAKPAIRLCVVCGKQYQGSPSSMRVTCSPECSLKHRRAMLASGKYDQAIETMVAARETHPNMQPDERHVNAREWIIQAPDGTVYHCRNLKHWLREHEDMLDGTVEQAWDGISKIKYTMQGKRTRNKSYQWKGWRLLEWEE